MKAAPRFFIYGFLLCAAVPLRAEEAVPSVSPVEVSTPASAAALTLPATAWVSVPVLDVRDVPMEVDGVAALRRPYAEDPHQETQLIYGEKVIVTEKRGAWVRVQSVEQIEYTHHEVWEGYPGWVRMDALSFDAAGFEPNAIVSALYAKLQESPEKGSSSIEIPLGARLRVIYRDATWARIQRHGQGDAWVRVKDLQFFDKFPRGSSALRNSILKTARQFIGQPYYWGGRCPHRDDISEHPTGVDCSSLVNLSYRLNGVEVPRDSHEQYLKSTPVRSEDLLPGDLIFLAKTENPNKIVHVMIYAGGDKVVEAVEQFDIVRQVTLKEKLGVALREISSGERTGNIEKSVVLDRYVYFGRFLPE